MTTAATMLDAHPFRPTVDTRLQGDTIDVLLEAARTAQQCADACLHESAQGLHHCIAANPDVADLAAATANMVVRMVDPPAVLAALVACRAALRACADSCRAHGRHLRHCAICAEVCDRAEDQCLRLEPSVSHLVVTDDDGFPGRAAAPRRVAAARSGGAGGLPDDLDITEGSAGRDRIHIVSDGGIGDGAD